VVLIARGRSPNIFERSKGATKSFGIFQDGAPIQLQIGDGTNQPLTYKFAQWALANGMSNGGGNIATLHGIADLQAYHSQTIKKAYKGNASDVIQQLAQQAGITNTDISATQDKMTWMPDGRSIAHYMRNLVDHAWMGSGACPHLALTSQQGQWLLRLKDIAQSSGSGLNFASIGLAGGSGAIPIWDFRINTRSGPLNKYQAYGSQVVQEMQSGTTNVFKSVNITPNVSSLGISGIAQGAVNVARLFFHPPDIGNTHPQFAKAYHNNRLVRSTFSTVINIMTKSLSTAKLLDDVNIQLARADGTVDPDFSGTYKVSAITRHISSGMYAEKLELSSQGAFGGQSGGEDQA